MIEALAVSFGLVALAEIGDKTQLLTLVLATRFRRPWPILAGIVVATLLNHLIAAGIGFFVGEKLEGPWLKWVIAASFFAIAIWAMFPDRLDEDERPQQPRLGVFGATAIAFFLVEIGDRTQIATAVLAAQFATWLPVVAGTTLGMVAANLPVVFLGGQLTRWIAIKWLRWGAVLLSAALGIAALLPTH
ncbi:MAG TPA: TMEM165/GDT1 family protein [Stellaceae bacterium]|nr:TMEM165/GDT1 family protein [Stellaceae bacterium]